MIRLMLVILAAVGTAYTLTALLGESEGGNLTASGRVKLPVDVDGVDAQGNPVGYSDFCEADAIVLLGDGKVLEVKEQGTNSPVAIGESVQRASPETSVGPVYRDEAGRLREGCFPGSVQPPAPASAD